MAGRKLFTNSTAYGVNVTLVIRRSDSPNEQAGTKEFFLGAHQAQWQEYGDKVNIYLNGIKLDATLNGQTLREEYIAIARGSQLDNSLNMRDGVDFSYSNNKFSLSTRQVR